MFKRKAIIILLVLGLLLGVLIFLGWVSLSQKKLIAYDVNSYEPDGLKAIKLILQKSGYRVAAIDDLSAHRQGLLILITTAKLSTGQARKILAWAAAGGTVIELTSSWPSLKANSNVLTTLTASAGRPFASNTATTFLTGLNYHPAKNNLAVITNPEEGFYGAGNRYFIYRQSYGSGSIISWNDLAGLSNRHLKKRPDNAAILVRLLQTFGPSQQIYFYNLALRTGNFEFNSWTGTALNRYWGICLLFLTAIVLLIWKLAARFGRPRPLVLARGRSYDEFVYSMAGLFQQAKIEQIVLDNLWSDLIRVIAELTHLPVSAAPDQLVAKLQALTGRDYQPVLRLYPPAKNLTPKQFLAVAVKLDAYRKELTEWRKSSQFVTKYSRNWPR